MTGSAVMRVALLKGLDQLEGAEGASRLTRERNLAPGS